MDETQDTKDTDQTQVGQQTPQPGEGAASEQTGGTSDSKEKTYTEADVKKLISDGKAELGRQVQQLTEERDGLKQRVETVEQGQREALAAKLVNKGFDGEKVKDLSLSELEKLDGMSQGITDKTQAFQITPDSNIASGGGKDLSGKSPMQLAREAYNKN